MVKIVTILLLLCSVIVDAHAEYDDTSRALPLQSFKERFTMGELMEISAAYTRDEYIRSAVLKLADRTIVDLDSDDLKQIVSYLTAKSILSENRARDILK